MRSALAHYLAFHSPDSHARRPIDLWPGTAPRRPSRTRRVTRNLAAGIPAALGVLRATIRLPADARPEPGTPVIAPNGAWLGELRAVVVALGSRRPLYAIDVEDGVGTELVLVSSEHVEPHDHRDALVLSDPARLAS